MKHFSIFLPLLLVSACSVTQAPAPVESRSPMSTAPAATSAPAVVPQAGPGEYVVKRGETLYSIALEHGHDYREVAAWNGITDPAVIREGQVLRVTPPGGAVPPAAQSAPAAPGLEVRPVLPTVPPPILASGPVVTPAASAPVAAASAPVVSAPVGGRVAYSDAAWRAVQAGEPLPATVSAPVAARPAASAPAAAVSAPAASAPAVARPQPLASTPASTPAKVDDDDMSWAWPAAGRLVGQFNDSSNKGVDIGGSIGDPVFASRAGKVVYVGSGLRGYGNLVIIKHDGNFLSAYAHNSEIYVKEQQQVQKGQKIAALGNSDADRAKLHFEIRRDGKPVDPLKYLPQR